MECLTVSRLFARTRTGTTGSAQYAWIVIDMIGHRPA
jgi:hypothetical protein